MRTRRSWLITAGTSALAILVCRGAVGAERVPLRNRLQAGLKARTKAEFAFLDRVVEMVEDGKLPRALVDRVFFWARKKAAEKPGPKKRRPMVYFQPALVRLARQIHIDL